MDGSTSRKVFQDLQQGFYNIRGVFPAFFFVTLQDDFKNKRCYLLGGD